MVNQLPQGWKEEELGKLVDIFDNLRKPVSSTERLARIKNKDKSELYPYYGATGLVDYIDGYIFDGEYLLLGEDGCPFLDSLKDKAYIISGKTWVNNHAHVLRAKENKTSNKFLLYYLNKFDYNGIVSGATRLKLNQNSMKKIPVYYPTDKSEQEYIVKTLDAVAEIIRLRKENIQLTKDLIPAIFHEMFGDPITNPKGWEILSLDNIITQITNAFKKNSSIDAVYGDIHFVNPNDLNKCVRYYSSRIFKRSLMRLGFMPAHPSIYIKRECILKYGLYKTHYKIAADFEFLLRTIFVYKIKTLYLPIDMVTMRTGGASTAGLEAYKQIMQEHLKAFKENPTLRDVPRYRHSTAIEINNIDTKH